MGSHGLRKYDVRDLWAFLQRSGYLDEHDFWSSLSGITEGTTFDHMQNYLTNEGYTGTPHDKFRKFIHAQTGISGTLHDMVSEWYEGTFSAGTDFIQTEDGLTIETEDDLGLEPE